MQLMIEILELFKKNKYQDFYNEINNLRIKYGFEILNENDYIKKLEKTIKEIKNEIENQINKIILNDFKNNNQNYQIIINNLIEEINSQKRDYDKKIKDLTIEMNNLQNRLSNKNEENQMKILIEKISLKEAYEKEREDKINNLTNKIIELQNKLNNVSNPPPPPPPSPSPSPSAIQYFPKTPYNGYSIVDGLEAIGHESRYEYRCKIAQVNNIQNYTGQPEQNLYMLKLLKNGQLIKP